MVARVVCRELPVIRIQVDVVRVVALVRLGSYLDGLAPSETTSGESGIEQKMSRRVYVPPPRTLFFERIALVEIGT